MNILVIVDMQIDFMSGTLIVPDNHEVILPIFRLAEEADLVIGTRDWHPPNHSSFEKWPRHCIKGTHGANIHPSIDRLLSVVYSKGEEVDNEGYSAWENSLFRTALNNEFYIDKKHDKITVCGLALDYCVKYTAMDIKLRGGFERVVVPASATKGIDQTVCENAIQAMETVGIKYDREG